MTHQMVPFLGRPDIKEPYRLVEKYIAQAVL